MRAGCDNTIEEIRMDCWSVTVSALFFCLILFVHGGATQENYATETFNVKPGGEVHWVEKQLGVFGCKFLYTAQGGTNEEWEMNLEKDEHGLYSCTVARPQGASYLFFEIIKMKLSGITLTRAEAYSRPGNPLDENEYTIDTRQHEVRADGDNFKSQLCSLTAYGVAERTEL